MIRLKIQKYTDFSFKLSLKRDYISGTVKVPQRRIISYIIAGI